MHFNSTTISKHNGWNKNKFLVVVIRILKILVNMYLKLFTPVHVRIVRLYMYAVVGGNRPRLSNSAVRISPVD